MEQEPLVRASISFRVPQDVWDEIIILATEAAKLAPTKSVVGLETSQTPHVTLYVSRFPERNLPKLLDIVKEIASLHAPVCFSSTGVNVKWRYVGITLALTDEIKKIHEEVVRSLNGLREGHTKYKETDSFDAMTPEELENIKTWGYAHVMNLYIPHITLLALEDEKNTPMVAESVSWNTEFFAPSITVLVSRKDGEGNRMQEMHEFPFASEN